MSKRCIVAVRAIRAAYSIRRSPKPCRRASRAFRKLLDVLQHARMDAVQEEIGPQTPVRRRREAQLVPRAALEPRAAVLAGNQAELAAPAREVAVEVRRMQVRVRAPLV